MLSYMLPVDEKPPPGPGKTHLQLSLASSEPLTNGRSCISKDNSISSFASDATTATASHSSMTPTSTSTDRAKPKLIVNGGKHQSLKRVSFGSSKGSMVETLIYETPLQEEPEPSPIPENAIPSSEDQTEDEREKVRVSFFQQSKPQEVDLPDETLLYSSYETDLIMSTPVSITETNHITYNRQESTDSGWENPFRPGGDLSREADEIVELIKGGKPITPTPGSQSPALPTVDEVDVTKTHSVPNNASPGAKTPITESPKKANNLQSSPQKNAKNGNAMPNDKTSPPGSVDVQRGTIRPAGDASQVEHITIKKKPKCKCCVIQ